jgi:hypothetical protein
MRARLDASSGGGAGLGGGLGWRACAIASLGKSSGLNHFCPRSDRRPDPSHSRSIAMSNWPLCFWLTPASRNR